MPFHESKAPSGPFVFNRDSASAYWFADGLWLILADMHQTAGAFSVMEQWMREGMGPPPHVHACDEWFYIIEGTLRMQADGQQVMARTGDSVWLPRGTDHSFTVVDGDAKVLNGYTPGGVEQLVAGLATPAERREMPPPDFPGPTSDQFYRFMTNYWTSLTDSPWSRTAPVRPPEK
jgi:quercetin dioxygenase-like cupin family protein